MALSDAQRTFLEETHFAVVATINADGTPQLTTLWYMLDGEDLVFNTAAGRLKERNLRRDPRMAATVLSADGYRFITVRGVARLDEESGQEVIEQLATRYHGAEMAAEQMRSQFSLERRITIRLAIEKPYSNGI